MKKIIGIIAFVIVCANNSNAQEDSTNKELKEVVVFANKFAEKKKNVAQKIDVIDSRTIAQLNGQNTGDLLINTGNVFVQKSQQGGSSPVVRGFEASRVLLVVDGIRMNNAIYRAGHLQNSITVDQNILDRVEVQYGPSSTLFGSDALGGVVHFRTKQPLLSSNGKLKLSGSSLIRYSTVNNENTDHLDLNLGGKKWAWLQSYTFSDFGNMKTGSKDPKGYPLFGKRISYIDPSGTMDEIKVNGDYRIQKYSAYKQWDILEKILFKQSNKISHLFTVQNSNSTDVPRYDRLQDTKNFGGTTGTTLRWAQWYYGPQNRWLAAYEMSIAKLSFADEIKLNVNYQDVKESRQQREYKRYDRMDSRREHVKVIGFDLSAKKTWKNQEVITGFDGQLNNVASVADRTNLLTGTVTKLDTRYPNGSNQMNFIGLYAQHLIKFFNNKLVVSDGLRAQAVSLNSTITDNSFFNLPFTSIKQSPNAITGNAGLVFNANKNWRLVTNFSSGFRAPNLDDAARIFESASASKQLVVPNPNVNPERTYNVDASIQYNMSNIIQFEITGYYTWFRNAMSLGAFKLNGNDSVLYNGTICKVVANQNINKAFSNGVNSRLKINFSKSLSLDNTITYSYGRYLLANSGEKPLDHIPPTFGRTALNYSKGNFSTEFSILYNGWKKIKDYNPDGEDNGQYATKDGMPSWSTLNLRLEYAVNKNLRLQGAVENLLDRNYRYFASGFSAPGRNFYFTMRTNF